LSLEPTRKRKEVAMPTLEEVDKQSLEQRLGRMSRTAEDLDSRDSLRQWPERR